MKQKTLAFGCCVFLGLLTLACGSGTDTVVQPDGGLDGGETDDPLANIRAVVVNSLGEDISLIGKDEESTVSLGVASLGQAPNQIMAWGAELLVLNSTSNSLQVLDPETWQTLREYGLGEGCSPFWMAEDGEGALVVTCFQSNELLRVNPEAPMDGQVEVERMDMPAGSELSPDDLEAPGFARPQGVLVSGYRAFVTLTNLGADYFAAGPGHLLVVDLAAWTQDRLQALPSLNPVSIAAAPGGQEAWISCASFYDGSGTLERISLERGDLLGSVAIGGAPGKMAFDSQGILWAGDSLEGQLLRYDPANTTVLDPVLLCPSNYEEGLYNFIADVQCDARGQVMAACFGSDEIAWFDSEAQDITRVLVGDGPTSLLLIDR